MAISTATSNGKSGPNPTVVFVTKQIGYTVSSLAMVAATVILALNHFIQDGEIVTLLVTAVGAHVLASVNGTNNSTTDNSVNTPAFDPSTLITQQMQPQPQPQPQPVVVPVVVPQYHGPDVPK